MGHRQLTTKILELLTTHHLLSPLDMVTLLDTGKTGYNKTSVYRALEKLQTAGVICKHTFATNEAVYELREHHHDHLVCSQCGRISTAECHITVPEDIDGFKVDHHHLTLFGKCYNCVLQNDNSTDTDQ